MTGAPVRVVPSPLGTAPSTWVDKRVLWACVDALVRELATRRRRASFAERTAARKAAARALAAVLAQVPVEIHREVERDLHEWAEWSGEVADRAAGARRRARVPRRPAR